MNAIPETNNPGWGFFDTMGDEAGTAWALALPRIAAATRIEPDAVRDFLDSRHGRHFADDVVGLQHAGLPLVAAIDAAVARWMGWRIDRRTARHTGIPEGLPYLAGFVMHAAIEAEAEVGAA